MFLVQQALGGSLGLDNGTQGAVHKFRKVGHGPENIANRRLGGEEVRRSNLEVPDVAGEGVYPATYIWILRITNGSFVCAKQGKT